MVTLLKEPVKAGALHVVPNCAAQSTVTGGPVGTNVGAEVGEVEGVVEGVVEGGVA